MKLKIMATLTLLFIVSAAQAQIQNFQMLWNNPTTGGAALSLEVETWLNEDTAGSTVTTLDIVNIHGFQYDVNAGDNVNGRVRACNLAGCSVWVNNTYSVTVDNSAPDAPTNLQLIKE